MRAVYEERIAEATEIEGQLLRGRDILVPPPKFTAVCKVLWPDKTAAHLATLADKDERTAKRWLSGEYEPPMVILIAIIHEMFKRQ